jgi:hypothetical protein
LAAEAIDLIAKANAHLMLLASAAADADEGSRATVGIVALAATIAFRGGVAVADPLRIFLATAPPTARERRVDVVSFSTALLRSWSERHNGRSGAE